MDEEIWVIVVDDDIPNLKIAGTILSENDMRVTALNSGTALLEYIKAGNKPDLILLDILMPKLDGFGTLWRLRKELRSDIPVIFLTADEDKESVAKGKSLGASDFIRKPFKPDDLVCRVRKVLDGGTDSEPEQSGGDLAERDAPAECDTPAERDAPAEASAGGGIAAVSAMFDEAGASHGALMLDKDTFGAIYRYLMRHMERYHGSAYKVMFRVEPWQAGMSEAKLYEAAEKFGEAMRSTLRNSDIVLRCSRTEYFILLPMVSEEDIAKVTHRVRQAWCKDALSPLVNVSCTTEATGCVRREMPEVIGLDWRYARLNLPNDKLLTDTVKDFCGSMQGRADRLNKAYMNIDADTEELTAYRIEVHAMKSSAAMVGLMQLSGLARTLEELAKAADTGGIHKLHDLFLAEWEKTRSELASAFELANNKEGKSGNAVLPTLLGILRSSIEEMDIDAVDRTLTKISSYKYDPHTEELIGKLREASMELDDSAEEIIKELLK